MSRVPHLRPLQRRARRVARRRGQSTALTSVPLDHLNSANQIDLKHLPPPRPELPPPRPPPPPPQPEAKQMAIKSTRRRRREVDIDLTLSPEAERKRQRKILRAKKKRKTEIRAKGKKQREDLRHLKDLKAILASVGIKRAKLSSIR